MSEIFISYSRPDRPIAAGLAKTLGAHGYKVWWDEELVGSDDYYEVILEALRQAKAVIVIWTSTSAKSRFVRDEARFALNYKKLIAVKERRLDPMDIPFGFQSQHTDDVENLNHILRALAKLGARQTAASAPMEPAQRVSAEWERLRTWGSAEDIVVFLGLNPPSQYKRAALGRLRDLSADRSAQGGRGKKGFGSLAMSDWQAFVSGLTFQAPKFQLSSQILPITFAYLAIIFACSIALLATWRTFEDDDIQQAAARYLPFIGLLVLTWSRFRSIMRQKYLPASLMLAACFVALSAVLGHAIGSEFSRYDEVVRLELQIVSAVLGAAASGALVAWEIRSAR